MASATPDFGRFYQTNVPPTEGNGKSKIGTSNYSGEAGTLAIVQESGEEVYEQGYISGLTEPLGKSSALAGAIVKRDHYLRREFYDEKWLGKYELHERKEHSREYLQAMRPRFLNVILKSLKDVQPHANTPNASMYVDQILSQINSMENFLPYDLMLEVLRALYDALALDVNWLKYREEQYETVFQLLSSIADLFPVTGGEVERAILKLAEYGFDILPYEMELPLEED